MSEPTLDQIRERILKIAPKMRTPNGSDVILRDDALAVLTPKKRFRYQLGECLAMDGYGWVYVVTGEDETNVWGTAVSQTRPDEQTIVRLNLTVLRRATVAEIAKARGEE